jgi:phosphopantothenate synthetase
LQWLVLQLKDLLLHRRQLQWLQ